MIVQERYLLIGRILGIGLVVLFGRWLSAS
jgi:hypothetical protein